MIFASGDTDRRRRYRRSGRRAQDTLDDRSVPISRRELARKANALVHATNERGPQTHSPAAGSGVHLLLLVSIEIGPHAAVFPAASETSSVRLCIPLASVDVFTDTVPLAPSWQGTA